MRQIGGPYKKDLRLMAPIHILWDTTLITETVFNLRFKKMYMCTNFAALNFSNGTRIRWWRRGLGKESVQKLNQCELECGGKCEKKCYDSKSACYISCRETVPAEPPTTAPAGEDCFSATRSGQSSNVDIKRTKRVQEKNKARTMRKGQKEPLPWGFFLKRGLRGPRSPRVCCSRGPRKGGTERTPRCCNPRTPRSSC